MNRIINTIITLIIALILSMPALPAKAESAISVGQYVQLGRCYGEPIMWRCVDIDENGPLMLSDKIIACKAFDAAGEHPNDHNDSRLDWGSNLWETSNIRSWLNSTASAGNVNWLCGNPPVEGNVRHTTLTRIPDIENPYAMEKGFLADGNFTESERSIIKPVIQHSLLNNRDMEMATSGHTTFSRNDYISTVVQNYDSAYAHDVTDKIFLLDLKQVNRVYQNLGDYYIAKPTPAAVANSNYKSVRLASDKTWHYWLRTPLTGSRYPCNVRFVNCKGYIFSKKASSSYAGVRPAFYMDLSSATFKSGTGSAANPYTVTIDEVQKDADIAIIIDNEPLYTDVSPIILRGRGAAAPAKREFMWRL